MQARRRAQSGPGGGACLVDGLGQRSGDICDRGRSGCPHRVSLVDRHYANKAAKRDLQHMLGTGEKFIGIDLRGRDLSGSYLAGKDFRGGRFDGANLEGATFRGPPPPLYPSENLYPSAGLYPMGTPVGVQPLPDANLREANIRGAKYDSSTEWPENYDPAENGAVLCEPRRSLRSRLSRG